MDLIVPVDWATLVSTPTIFLSIAGYADAVMDRVTVEDVTAHAGGLTGALVRAHVIFHRETDPTPRYVTAVGKATREGGRATSVALGLAREGPFYAQLAPRIDPRREFLPVIYHAQGDLTKGGKIVLMEDLQTPDHFEDETSGKVKHDQPKRGAQGGYFFGPNSVLNRAIADRLPGIVAPYGLDEAEVARRCARAAAKLHAAFWGRGMEEFGEGSTFLRGAPWRSGEDAGGFAAAVAYVVDKWSVVLDRAEKGEIVVGERLRNVVDLAIVSMKELKVTQYAEKMKERVVTVVHGDFHPANVVVVASPDYSDSRVVLVDWEVVGFGSGPQDIGQFLISHSSPQSRREIERSVVATYDATLRKSYRDLWGENLDMSQEKILREVIIGGVGRWAFLFAYIAATSPSIAVSYFHDQLDAFIADHNISPQDVIGELRL